MDLFTHNYGLVNTHGNLHGLLTISVYSFLAALLPTSLKLNMFTLQEAVEQHRGTAAKQLVPLRPRIFPKEAAQAPAQMIMDDEGDSQSRTPPAATENTSTKVLYLRSKHAPVRGVMQLHQA